MMASHLKDQPQQLVQEPDLQEEQKSDSEDAAAALVSIGKLA
jgi:hypothetical protein